MQVIHFRKYLVKNYIDFTFFYFLRKSFKKYNVNVLHESTFDRFKV